MHCAAYYSEKNELFLGNLNKVLNNDVFFSSVHAKDIVSTSQFRAFIELQCIIKQECVSFGHCHSLDVNSIADL